MNLIVTCARNLEEDASKEMEKILENLGDEKPIISISDMPGILTIQTEVNPLMVIKSMKEKIIDEPWSIRYCLRIIPIQEESETIIQEISKHALYLFKTIPSHDTYRITVEKRNSDLSTQALISEIAKKIPNKVSLEKPNWIILIEIIGNETGVSVLEEGSILSVQKAKRALSE